ncbi:hypothetical protein LTR17_017951 [Elasticomyces elasticus]|nr:hypothetical protein LTR17_017951 [Elasticomyces elasticus]
MITRIEAQLTYDDGSPAHFESGIELDSIVFSNTGRKDGTCPARRQAERFFAGGNRLAVLDLATEETQQGYYIHHNDTLLMTGKVANLTPHPKRLVVSVLWDYIINPSDSVQRVTPYWLDIRGCSSSRLSSQVNSQFSLRSPGYLSNFHGEIVAIVGHLQDGGTLLEIKRDGRTECELKAEYPSSGARTELQPLNHHHIQRVSSCTQPLMMTPTSLWRVVAHYDTFSYLPRLGYLKNIEPAMGIALIYVRRTDYLEIDATMEEDKGKWWILNLLRAFLCLATLVTLSGMGLFALRRRPNCDVYPDCSSDPTTLKSSPEELLYNVG